MMSGPVFLFGEAEKGEFCTPLLISSIPQLAETLGAPPQESQGIFYAVQTLLFQRDLIFFRVHEEGLSEEDYMHGFRFLQNPSSSPAIGAVCMPGVADPTIINPITSLCASRNAILIISHLDFYDLLTS